MINHANSPVDFRPRKHVRRKRWAHPVRGLHVAGLLIMSAACNARRRPSIFDGFSWIRPERTQIPRFYYSRRFIAYSPSVHINFASHTLATVLRPIDGVTNKIIISVYRSVGFEPLSGILNYKLSHPVQTYENVP